ncbi:histidine phosphatase family protein [Modicisalibacter luteus]|uniref:histidine phosphatase family protein n=1 Tax=Modicisalibacter luteus TaxID=453962 RepID=UPI0036448677
MPELIRRPFVFLRHGQSVWNREGRIAGSQDVPLTPQGEDEARRAFALLGEIDWPLIVSSPLERARRTAELATGRHPHQLIEGLKERHWGHFEGQPAPRPMPYLLEPEEGESWETFAARIVVTLNTILESEATPPLVVGHSGLIRVIRFVACGSPEAAHGQCTTAMGRARDTGTVGNAPALVIGYRAPAAPYAVLTDQGSVSPARNGTRRCSSPMISGT